ncbi:hypothetical protein Tco_0218633 [Tanacetum coccineum]
MIAYLQKSEGSEGFHQIIDFLNDSHIQYALTENPTIYVSFIKQFWSTTTARASVTGEVESNVTNCTDKKKVIMSLSKKISKVGGQCLSLHEMTVQCTNFSKQTYGTALTKLIKKVKKLEQTVKTSQSRRRTRVVLSDEEEVSEDPSKQGRSLIEELDLDAEIYLVPPHDAEIQEKIRSGEKGEQEVNTASVPISTANATPEVSTATANLVYIIRSAEKRKDKGKVIMIEDESVQKKSKKQLEQERLSHEEAIRLHEQIDEEERKRIARDAEIAKKLQEEYDKAKKKEDVAKIDTAHAIYWNDPFVIRYHALQNGPRSIAKTIFEKVWDQVHSFVPMDSKEEVQRLKRAGQDVEAKPAKRQRTKEVSESVQEQTDEEPKTDELS